MADIDLERKPQRKAWPWIVGALVAVLAIWAVWEAIGPEEQMAGDVDRPAVVGPTIPPASGAGETRTEEATIAITDFRQQCVDTPAGETMGLQHEWTATCLENLARAMGATIQVDTVGSIALQQRLDALREHAEEVRRSEPSATTHAGTVAEAFDAGAELIQAYQEERGATDAGYAADVQQAADQLRSEGLLLEQKEAVDAYFRSVGSALERIRTGA